MIKYLLLCGLLASDIILIKAANLQDLEKSSDIKLETDDDALNVESKKRVKREIAAAEDDKNSNLMLRIDFKYGDTDKDSRRSHKNKVNRGEDGASTKSNDLDLGALVKSVNNAIFFGENSLIKDFLRNVYNAVHSYLCGQSKKDTNYRADNKNTNYFEINTNDVIRLVNNVLASDATNKFIDNLADTAAKIYRRFN